MRKESVDSFAARIIRARHDATTIDAASMVAEHDGPHTVDDAYRIQQAITAYRLSRGEHRIGWKLGYTSLAMREQMGIASPNHGPLTDAMLLSSPAKLPELVLQPKVEPEIAVRLSADLAGAVTIDDVLAAIAEANACLEVVDSVWTGYRFRLEDNTADGSSAAFVVLGPQLRADDLAAVSVELRRNGCAVASATGAAASGHPAAGVAWLSAELTRRGDGLRAGDLIITGGLTAAVTLDRGDLVSASFNGGAGAPVEVSVRRG